MKIYRYWKDALTASIYGARALNEWSCKYPLDRSKNSPWTRNFLFIQRTSMLYLFLPIRISDHYNSRKYVGPIRRWAERIFLFLQIHHMGVTEWGIIKCIKHSAYSWSDYRATTHLENTDDINGRLCACKSMLTLIEHKSCLPEAYPPHIQWLFLRRKRDACYVFLLLSAFMTVGDGLADNSKGLLLKPIKLYTPGTGNLR